MKELKIYRCVDCGYVVEVIDSGKRQMFEEGHSFTKRVTFADAILVCCDKKMELVEPNTAEASAEKHMPAIEFIGDGKVKVKIGSVAHPMIAEHYIKWITIIADDRLQRVELEPGQTPEAEFYIGAAVKVDAYAYCNEHSLWKASANK